MLLGYRGVLVAGGFMYGWNSIVAGLVVYCFIRMVMWGIVWRLPGCWSAIVGHGCVSMSWGCRRCPFHGWCHAGMGMGSVFLIDVFLVLLCYGGYPVLS